MTKNWLAENEPEIRGFVLRNAVVTVSQPVEYAKLLIQLGYEPFVATESTSFLFRKKYLGLPNVLTYLKYIKGVDGFVGCFRGLIPRLCHANVYYVVYNKVSDLRPGGRGGDEGYKGSATKMATEEFLPSRAYPSFFAEMIPSDMRDFMKTLGWDVVCVSVGTSVSYPFHLIAVRTMAQFVGRETKFNTLWGSIAEIFNTEGILGFFNGLIPRLISEVLTVVIAGTCVFVVTKHITKRNQQITNLGGSLLANAVAYQFHVVSNNMAANGSGLLIGSPPYAKHYPSWYDCWLTLRRDGQLTRAANVVARQYTGQAEIRGDRLIPVNYPFGPIHPRGLGAIEGGPLAYDAINPKPKPKYA